MRLIPALPGALACAAALSLAAPAASQVRSEVRTAGVFERYTFDDGLRQTVQWYLDNEDWWRPLRDGQATERRGLKG